MDEILKRLSAVIELGKIDRATPYPPEMKDQDGAAELTAQAINLDISPQEILNNGLMPGMQRIGEKFAKGEAFIPNMLIAAKAMNAAMEQLRPHFNEGEIPTKGTLILGTVKGDLHDIGKNLLKMIMTGDGWNIIDLGTDVSSEQFVEAVNKHQNAVVGLSALLTTTMLYMEEIVKHLRKNNPATKVFIGGAPVSKEFCDKIGADGYYREPYSFARSFDNTH